VSVEWGREGVVISSPFGYGRVEPDRVTGPQLCRRPVPLAQRCCSTGDAWGAVGQFTDPPTHRYILVLPTPTSPEPDTTMPMSRDWRAGDLR
jgi:hypothetical protein